MYAYISQVENPELKSSFLSRSYYCWLSGILNVGRNKVLDFIDLFPLNARDTADVLFKRWNNNFKSAREGSLSVKS